jgi:hypothetical protein
MNGASGVPWREPADRGRRRAAGSQRCMVRAVRVAVVHVRLAMLCLLDVGMVRILDAQLMQSLDDVIVA